MEQQATPTANATKQPTPSPAPDSWAGVRSLPCTLSVSLPMGGITVGDLLRLEVNSIVDSRQGAEAPLPVWVNGVMVASSEFDVAGERLAIRITELR
ncbi:MAG: FliM/FliN family flagellar motor switch protein [Terriglobia bacterium]